MDESGRQVNKRSAVIEVLGRDGQVRSVHKIERWPATIGRSPACDVVLDDAYMAGEHARLEWSDEAGPLLLLAPSLNGGWHGEQRLAAGASAALGGQSQFQLGATQLRWRSTAEPLPAELPLERHQHRSVKPSALWLAVALPIWLLSLGFEHWLGVDPGTSLVEYAAPVLGPLGAVLVWSAVWALVTQLFQHRFPFGTHLRRVLAWLLAVYVISQVLPALAYAFSLPRLMALEEIVMAVGSAALIWWHAVVVWPRARRRLVVVLGVLLVLGMGLTLARRSDQQHWLGPTYLSALPPPALRIASPKPPEALLDELKTLREPLARQARKDEDRAASEDEE